MLKRVMRIAAVAFAVVATGSASRADFTIDDFSTPGSQQTYSLAGAVGSTFSQTDTVSTGVTRKLTVTQIANSLGNAGATSGVFGNGKYSLSTSAGTTAFTSLLYTYTTPKNLSADETAVRFTFDFADLNTPFSVRVSDGTTTDTKTGSVSSSTTGIFSLDISGFAVDRSNIKSIELLLNRSGTSSTTSADLILSDVSITAPRDDNPPPPAVPAPAPLALFAAALPALGLARRFVNKA